MPLLTLFVFNLWKWLLISLFKVLISCRVFRQLFGLVLHFFNRRALLFILFLMCGGWLDFEFDWREFASSGGAMLSTTSINLLSKQFQYACTLSNGIFQSTLLSSWIKTSFEYFWKFLLYMGFDFNFVDLVSNEISKWSPKGGVMADKFVISVISLRYTWSSMEEDKLLLITLDQVLKSTSWCKLCWEKASFRMLK